MSKDQYKSWLTSVPEDNTKEKFKLCAQTFLLSNMGEQALKYHAVGTKHITTVTQTQKTGSVTDFFTVKCGATPGASRSASFEEPSTPLVCDTKDTSKDSGSVATQESYNKICLKERTTQSWNLWAFKVCNVSFLIQLINWYYRYPQCYVSR